MSIIGYILDEGYSFNWCQREGVCQIFRMAKVSLNIIHIVVPIGLIAMTVYDVAKNVINPDSKDGQKTILNRAISAVIVFFVPLLVSFVMKLIDIGKDRDEDDVKVSDEVKSGSCWNLWDSVSWEYDCKKWK